MAECDGFEIKQKDETNVNLKLILYIDHGADMHKLSPPLASILDMEMDSTSNIIMALWQYIKVFLSNQSSTDYKTLRTNDILIATT
jgi:chromatin remodeling complex protein RSC6